MSAVGRQKYRRAEHVRTISWAAYYFSGIETLPSEYPLTFPMSPFKEKHMKPFVRTSLAIVAAGVALAGCATYDYGPGYTYGQPYNGYNYRYSGYESGPYSYDYGPYYYGPSYVAPSVGLGFTYSDRDRRNYDRNYYRHRDNDARPDNGYRRGDNEQWRGDRGSSRSAAPYPSGRDDPWGGTNMPNDRNSQQ